MKLIIQNKKRLILENVKVADNFFSRLFGFIGRIKIKEEEGILFMGVNSIHTFFVFTFLDVVFLDKNRKVLKIVSPLKPFRLSFCKRAYYTLELAPYFTKKVGLEINDILEF